MAADLDEHGPLSGVHEDVGCCQVASERADCHNCAKDASRIATPAAGDSPNPPCAAPVVEESDHSPGGPAAGLYIPQYRRKLSSSPLGVVSAAESGRTYALLRVLCHDKAEVIVMLGAPLLPPAEPGKPPVLSDERVVVKRVHLSGQAGQQALTELRALRTLAASGETCEHMVPLLDVKQDDRFVYIIMPYLNGGDMFEQVRGSGVEVGLPPDQAKRYLRHIIEGLLYLKRHGIAHGDVSLENVMLSLGRESEAEEPTARLIDLGSCAFVDSQGRCPVSGFCFKGKPSYIPPEALAIPPAAAGIGSPVTEDDDTVASPTEDEDEDVTTIDPFAADVWSLANTLYCLLTAHPLYSGPADVAFNVLLEERALELIDHYSTFGLYVDPLARELICSMLHPRPSRRPTLEQILRHPWLTTAE